MIPQRHHRLFERILCVLHVSVAVLSCLCSVVNTAGAQSTQLTTVRPEWTILADGPGNQTQVTLATDSARTLHVVSWSDGGNAGQSYQHRTISESGTLSSATTILSAWQDLNFPQLLLRSDGTLALHFFGNRSGDSSDPYVGVGSKRLTSSSDFTTWTLDSQVYDGQPGLGYPGDNTAAINASGQEVVASAQGGNVRSFNTTTLSAIETSSRSCCAYLAHTAFHPTSEELVVGFYSNYNEDPGLFFQTLAPSLGTITKAPGSGADPRVTVPLEQRGGSLYTAYSNETNDRGGIRVWEVGSASNFVAVPQSDGAIGIVLTSDGEHLWAVWGVADGTTDTYLSRSNAAGTRFGRKIRIAGPPGSTSLFYRSATAARGHLDLFMTTNGQDILGSRYARISVPLEITVRPTRLNGVVNSLAVKVTDGDSPVSGALVRSALGRIRTNRRGLATVPVNPSARQVTIAASKTGFISSSVIVRRR